MSSQPIFNLPKLPIACDNHPEAAVVVANRVFAVYCIDTRGSRPFWVVELDPTFLPAGEAYKYERRSDAFACLFNTAAFWLVSSSERVTGQDIVGLRALVAAEG